MPQPKFFPYTGTFIEVSAGLPIRRKPNLLTLICKESPHSGFSDIESGFVNDFQAMI